MGQPRRRIDKDADPATVSCTVNPATARAFKVGDFVVFNDEAADPNIGAGGHTSARKSSVLAATATWSPPATSSSSGTYPGVRCRLATFGTLRCAAPKGHPVLQARHEDVHVLRQEGLLPDAGIPARIEAKLPSRASSRCCRRGDFGFGPFTVFPLSPP